MKYFLIFLAVIVFQGCFYSVNTVNKSNYQGKVSYQKQEKTILEKNSSSGFYNIKIQTVKNTKKFNKKMGIYTGSIKGIIKSITHVRLQKNWKYEVEGIDTSYGKLPYAEFYHDKKLAKKGDLVYIILDNSNLKNLFFIKKANRISKKKRTYKRVAQRINTKQKKYLGKRKIELGVPTVENITF